VQCHILADCHGARQNVIECDGDTTLITLIYFLFLATQKEMASTHHINLLVDCCEEVVQGAVPCDVWGGGITLLTLIYFLFLATQKVTASTQFQQWPPHIKSIVWPCLLDCQCMPQLLDARVGGNARPTCSIMHIFWMQCSHNKRGGRCMMSMSCTPSRCKGRWCDAMPHNHQQW